jgi:hypothetical protein
MLSRAARGCAPALEARECCDGRRWGTTCWWLDSTGATFRCGRRIHGALAKQGEHAAGVNASPDL